MELSKQHQMNLLTMKISTIGELELLRLHHEKVKQQTVSKLVHCTQLLNSGSIFTEEMVRTAIGVGQFSGTASEKPRPEKKSL
jgi:hypothetical protein